MPLCSVALSLDKNSSLITILPEPKLMQRMKYFSTKSHVYRFLKNHGIFTPRHCGAKRVILNDAERQQEKSGLQSQCNPGLRKIIRSELSDFCKMLVDIEASTRNGTYSMCGRVNVKIRAWRPAFTTSVFPALPSIHLSYPYLIFAIFGTLPLVAVLTNISYVHILRCNIC